MKTESRGFKQKYLTPQKDVSRKKKVRPFKFKITRGKV